MGNALIQDSATGQMMELREGFIPVGMKEHGGILYIVSADKEGNGEIGTIPSPIITWDYADATGSISDYLIAKGKDIYNICQVSTKLHPGEQYALILNLDSGIWNNNKKYFTCPNLGYYDPVKTLESRTTVWNKDYSPIISTVNQKGYYTLNLYACNDYNNYLIDNTTSQQYYRQDQDNIQNSNFWFIPSQVLEDSEGKYHPLNQKYMSIDNCFKKFPGTVPAGRLAVKASLENIGRFELVKRAGSLMNPALGESYLPYTMIIKEGNTEMYYTYFSSFRYKSDSSVRVNKLKVKIIKKADQEEEIPIYRYVEGDHQKIDNSILKCAPERAIGIAYNKQKYDFSTNLINNNQDTSYDFYTFKYDNWYYLQRKVYGEEPENNGFKSFNASKTSSERHGLFYIKSSEYNVWYIMRVDYYDQCDRLLGTYEVEFNPFYNDCIGEGSDEIEVEEKRKQDNITSTIETRTETVDLSKPECEVNGNIVSVIPNFESKYGNTYDYVCASAIPYYSVTDFTVEKFTVTFGCAGEWDSVPTYYKYPNRINKGPLTWYKGLLFFKFKVYNKFLIYNYTSSWSSDNANFHFYRSDNAAIYPTGFFTETPEGEDVDYKERPTLLKRPSSYEYGSSINSNRLNNKEGKLETIYNTDCKKEISIMPVIGSKNGPEDGYFEYNGNAYKAKIQLSDARGLNFGNGVSLKINDKLTTNYKDIYKIIPQVNHYYKYTDKDTAEVIKIPGNLKETGIYKTTLWLDENNKPYNFVNIEEVLDNNNIKVGIQKSSYLRAKATCPNHSINLDVWADSKLSAPYISSTKINTYDVTSFQSLNPGTYVINFYGYDVAYYASKIPMVIRLQLGDITVDLTSGQPVVIKLDHLVSAANIKFVIIPNSENQAIRQCHAFTDFGIYQTDNVDEMSANKVCLVSDYRDKVIMPLAETFVENNIVCGDTTFNYEYSPKYAYETNVDMDGKKCQYTVRKGVYETYENVASLIEDGEHTSHLDKNNPPIIRFTNE